MANPELRPGALAKGLPRALTKGKNERECIRCGKVFRAWSPAKTTKYCSRACSDRHCRERNPNRAKGCAVCRRLIDVPKPGPNQKTCGQRECMAEFVRRKTRRQVKCKRCESLFWPVRQSNGMFEKWCSRKCYDADRAANRWVVVPCSACGRTIRKARAQMKRWANAFCSRACQAEYFKGHQHPLFRGDADPNRGRGWKRIAEEVRKRDGYCCQRCGKTQAEDGQRLAIDHLIPWRRFEDKDAANDPSNLYALCKACHGYKTTYVERRWLRGDVMAFEQFRASLTLPSAIKGHRTMHGDDE